MADIFLVLQRVHSNLLMGTPVDQGTRELAAVICSAICEHKPENSGFQNATSRCWDESNDPQRSTRKRPFSLMDGHEQEKKRWESLCFALSLLDRMSSKPIFPCHTVDSKLNYKHVLRILLEDMDLMSKLVSLFGIQDKLLCHLVVKSVSSIVIFQLQESNKFNSVWQQMCLDTFRRGCPCTEMVGCLWSLTAVSKGVLKGTHENKRELLEKLFLAFDPVLPGLYTGLLSQMGKGPAATAYPSDTHPLETVQMTLIDLLEVLAAVRAKLEMHTLSQRLLYVQAFVLLHLSESPVHYSVKKKALLLLKRVLLQKAGEDLCTGAIQPATQGDGQMTTDLQALANSVLESVCAGWLQRVSVSAMPSLFGGTGVSGPGSREGPDFVMLRAVSLVLLKSLEYNVQHVSQEGSLCSVDIKSYLSPLMLFLSQHLTRSPQLCHPCTWVSLVFGEQDDDMMEATKTLMLLYLYQRRINALSMEDACSTGYNPHCHFILLLKSVTFDHSVLLDFLISAETCFLEYFVGYLKLLRENWEDFCSICQYIQGLDSEGPGWRSSACEHESPVSPKAGSERPANQTSPQCHQSSAKGIAQSSIRLLVDYGSSDDSESEEQSAPGSPLGKSQNERPEFNHVGARGQLSYTADHVVEQAQDHHLTPTDVQVKTVTCLTELREVVARLQKRNLFPYRADSLLKLLMQIETKSSRGHGLQC